ncbi:NAD-dependent epimerase/dehydratase family protein [Nocardioides coralli]|uniref:NAD-dependent epimerase/dehydratase family protein n=1 Tax=Nocardioides coralli TaxID=2872154 RepID=UPI001CA46833|nr:NAD-dependent epimerase/dehydratase family protein [Nocardioides coralli]QZY28372.1 NAD-dependent epimerase/dehydratase family protein [Nocardioides coralli]
MRYSMTGATGFLGGELARQLVGAGHDVVALVRDRSRATGLRAMGVELVEGDLDDRGALDELMLGADGFFHVAGWYKHGLREHEALRRVNIEGTRNALEAARRAGVARTVYTSTIALNSDTEGEVVDEDYRFTGTHVTEYDRTKGVAHDVAEEYAAAGLPLVIVQPSVIYGPGDVGSTLGQMTRQLVAGRTVLGPRGGGACFAHVEDVARGHVLAMEQGRVGESYILAGPAAEHSEVLERTRELAGAGRVVLLPPAVIKVVAAVTAPLERLVRLPQPLTSEAARAGMATYYGTAGKAARDLGWTVRPLEEGLAETVAAIRAGE